MQLSTIYTCSVLSCKCNNGFPLHSCPATKHFVLLLKIISIKFHERVSVFLLQLPCVKSACAVLCCRLCAVWLYHAFPHYLTHGTIFGKNLIENEKRVLIFSTTFSDTFLILRRIQRDITINVHNACQSFRFESNFNFSKDFKKNSQFHEYLSGANRLVSGEQTDMTNLNSRFRNFANSPIKKCNIFRHYMHKQDEKSLRNHVV